MKRIICVLSLMLASSTVFSNEQPKDQEREVYSQKKIEAEIQDAEKEFESAKKMFSPWYAGPLITPSPHVLEPGLVNVQPYLFITNNYGEYTRSGSSRSIPTLFQVNPSVVAQFGIVKHLSFMAVVQGLYSKQNDKSSFNYMDTTLRLNIEILKEQAHKPAIAFTIAETFPSGKYQRLDPGNGGLDTTGAGAYQTTFSFNIGKVVWWIPSHPMNVRFSLNYAVASNVHVRSFNAYGGGYGTDGTVKVGDNVTLDFGYEYSFTKKWVIACDAVYTYTASSTFSGNPGIDKEGNPASVGSPFNDQLSFAPALEYNPTENLGILAGVWVSAWGRNSSQFVSGVLTLEYTF